VGIVANIEPLIGVANTADADLELPPRVLGDGKNVVSIRKQVERARSAPSVSLHLIHNNIRDRYECVTEQLSRLQHHLGGEAPLHEHAYQVDFAPSARTFRVAQAGIWAFEERYHRRYRKLWYESRIASLRDLLSRGKKIAVAAREPLTDEAARLSRIQIVLTDKHIRAHGAFLEGDQDLIIVCEDDVVFQGDSLDKLDAVLDVIRDLPKDRYVYVDLAGGFSVGALQIDALSTGQHGPHEFIKTFEKLVTNTTCCYLMNRALAVRLYSILMQYPELRRLAIGRTINTAAHLVPDLVENRGLYALTAPPVFRHGTLIGAYESAIQPFVAT
jgi:hypothetical protein